MICSTAKGKGAGLGSSYELKDERSSQCVPKFKKWLNDQAHTCG